MKHTEATKLKISLTKKGNSPAWNKGKPWSEEVKKKVSLSKKGKPTNSPTKFKKGHTPWVKGKEATWAKGENNVHYGKFGKDHPCYKDIKKRPFYKQIRETYKYRQWRSDVFTRDDFTCVLCEVRGVFLEADHIKRFIDIIHEYKIETLEQAISCEELWNINNGRTLCQDCHRKTDTWGKRPFKIHSN